MGPLPLVVVKESQFHEISLAETNEIPLSLKAKVPIGCAKDLVPRDPIYYRARNTLQTSLTTQAHLVLQHVEKYNSLKYTHSDTKTVSDIYSTTAWKGDENSPLRPV